ncbi:hypothetical protein CZ809_02116 [Photobacterium piscicola]|uniref:Uncharacterized protein n=1 Tax=Photobacterium piscicola TaxID=1378299 RepID=A0A1T5I0L1_9GAMM|nr:hypothetical protein CZ809_02116 [Photobacterium piscicola]
MIIITTIIMGFYAYGCDNSFNNKTEIYNLAKSDG